MKITGGKYNSLLIKTADYTNIKPTLSKIRQAVFNTISSMGDFKYFCDLFAGSGIMSFEALSRNFEVYCVEIDKKSAGIIIKNSTKFDSSLNLFNTDALKFLSKTNMQFDVFYIDPPYNSDLYDKTLEIISKKNLLVSNGIIILEKPCNKNVCLKNFDLIKEKIYGDKSIYYLKNK